MLWFKRRRDSSCLSVWRVSGSVALFELRNDDVCSLKKQICLLQLFPCGSLRLIRIGRQVLCEPGVTVISGTLTWTRRTGPSWRLRWLQECTPTWSTWPETAWRSGEQKRRRSASIPHPSSANLSTRRSVATAWKRRPVFKPCTADCGWIILVLLLCPHCTSLTHVCRCVLL